LEKAKRKDEINLMEQKGRNEGNRQLELLKEIEIERENEMSKLNNEIECKKEQKNDSLNMKQENALKKIDLDLEMKQLKLMKDNMGDKELISCALKNSDEKNPTNFIKVDLMKLIMSQDRDDGFWDESEETKNLIGIITEDKFNKIKNKVKELNFVEQENKITFTILVIYYLFTEQSQKIKENRLVINKAYKFLMNFGIKYEDFILQIEN
jgi:hypothetical protein